MPLTSELRTDAWRIFLMIKERDMPSNNTAERLQQRTAIPIERVIAALNLLWSDDAGFLRMDCDRRTGVIGYYVDPKCKKKTQNDLVKLYANWEIVKEADDDEDDWADIQTKEPDDDDDGEDDEDGDSEWDEMDEEDLSED